MKRFTKMTALVLSALIGILPIAAGSAYASGAGSTAGVFGAADDSEKKATPSDLEIADSPDQKEGSCSCEDLTGCAQEGCECETWAEHEHEDHETGPAPEPVTDAEKQVEALPATSGKVSKLAKNAALTKNAGLLGVSLNGNVADWERCNISASFNGSNVVLTFDLDYYAGGGGTKYFFPKLSVNPTASFYGQVIEWGESAVPRGGNLGTLTLHSYNRTGGTSEAERHLTLNATFVIAADKLSSFNSDGKLCVYAGGWGDGFWAYGNFEVTPAGWSTAYAQATCSHSYNRYEAVNASTHRLVCSKCGLAARTESHDSNTADTTSRPGYTIRKCSKCGYTVSTTANRYTVTLSQAGATTPGTGSVTATYGAAMPAVTVPKRTGYAFMGYFTGQNGTGTKYYTETGASARAYGNAGNLTLYASWVRTYEVTKTDNLKNGFKILGS